MLSRILLYLSYEMQRRAISHSYGIVGTSLQLDSRGGRHGRDYFQYRASERAGLETARNRSRRLPRDAGCLRQQPDAAGRSGSRARLPAGDPGHAFAVEERAMTAMQLTCPDLSPQQERSTTAIEQEGERSGILPADKPASVTAQFRPLDPGVVSEAIPAFFIGRNKEGFWVARDVNGQIGGIFLFGNSAVSFAKE